MVVMLRLSLYVCWGLHCKQCPSYLVLHIFMFHCDVMVKEEKQSFLQDCAETLLPCASHLIATCGENASTLLASKFPPYVQWLEWRFGWCSFVSESMKWFWLSNNQGIGDYSIMCAQYLFGSSSFDVGILDLQSLVAWSMLFITLLFCGNASIYVLVSWWHFNCILSKKKSFHFTV